eukprot:m.131778 g.131778  ORF g.131778 m.131778 type:complete len:1080 (+) comp16828_c0_seq1:339-3578(+)
MASLQSLEHAVNQVNSPAGAVSAEARHEAEAVLLQFRGSADPYDTCMQIYEHSSNLFLWFEAAKTLKQAVMRDWASLPKTTIDQISSYVLNKASQSQQLPRFVLEQLLSTAAVIFKRGWSAADGSPGSSRDAFFQQIQQLWPNAGPVGHLARLLCSSILHEFASTSRTSHLGLTWEAHFTAKKQFETNDLKQILTLVVPSLGSLLPLDASKVGPVLLSEAALAEQVFGWNFTTWRAHRLIGTIESERTVQFRPGKTWSDVFTGDLLTLFFSLYMQARSLPGARPVACSLLQVLIQLASVASSSFSGMEQRFAYFQCYIQNLSDCIVAVATSPDVQGFEVQSLATSLARVVSVFGMDAVEGLPLVLQQKFVMTATQFSVFCLERMVEEDDMEDPCFTESFGRLVEFWGLACSHVAMVGCTSETPAAPHAICDLTAVASPQVFGSYVQCRLKKARKDALSTEDVPDFVETDRVAYEDQLCGVAALARSAPAECLGLLMHVVSEKAALLVAVRMGQMPSDQAEVYVLFEEFHWLVLISGHVLADRALGETPVIPASLMQLSMAAPPTADPVVKLGETLVRFVNDEAAALSSNPQAIAAMSPQVSATLLWFVRRWARTYLLPDEKNYSMLSPSIVQAFGQDTEGASMLVQALARQALSAMLAWRSEPTVVEEAARLLLDIATWKHTREEFFGSEVMWELTSALLDPQNALLGHLAPELQQTVAQAICKACSAAKTDQILASCLGKVLEGINQRFVMLVADGSVFGKLGDPAVVNALCTSLGLWRGACRAMGPDNCQMVLASITPHIEAFARMFTMCREQAQLITELLMVTSDLTVSGLGAVPPEGHHVVLSSCLRLLKEFATVASTRPWGGDEAQSDILLLLKLLVEVAACDSWSTQGGESSAQPSVVVLLGLQMVVPLMTGEMLQLPEVCKTYFTLLGDLCLESSEQVYGAPDDLLAKIFVSVEHALVGSRFGTHVSRCGLLCLFGLASEHDRRMQAGQPRASLVGGLQHMLEVVFRCFVLEPFDTDLLEPACNSMFALLCCAPDHFLSLAQGLLRQQTAALCGTSQCSVFGTHARRRAADG